MNILFAHDHYFKLDKKTGLLYSDGKLSKDSFSRYLKSFDKVGIVSRFTSIDTVKISFNLISNENIIFYPFDNQSNLNNRFIKRILYEKKMREIVSKYDGLVVRLPSEIGFLAAKVALDIGKPYICEIVACPYDAMNGFGTFKSKMYRHIIVSNMKKYVKLAYASLYVTNNFLQRKYPCDGQNFSASNVEIDKIIYRNFRDIEKKECIKLALVGNLDSPHKGYETVYKSISYFNTIQNKTFIIYLVGGGSKYKIDFDDLGNVSILYTGSLDKEALFALLDDADIYIQPSNQEGLPRATIEAMSRGLPCVVSDAGGLPELIDSQFVHSVNNSKEFFEKISSLLNNELYSRESINNSKTSERFLSSNLQHVRERFYSNYYRYLKDLL